MGKNTRLFLGTSLYFYERVTADMLDEKSFMLDRILLINVVCGDAKVTINGTDFTVNSQDFMFLPPHSNIHLIEASGDFEVIALGFVMALQESIMQKLGHSFFSYVFRILVWHSSKDGKRLLDAFCTLYEMHCRQTNDTYSTEIASSLFNIFLLSFYNHVKDKFEANVNTTVTSKSLAARFAYLLHDNFKQQHSVSFYADKLCVSNKYLTQIIKTNTGVTPKFAIDRAIGMESLFMLNSTSFNIQEISNILGFPDQSYFGRFFKRLFGCSPMAYRLNPDLKILERLRNDAKRIDAFELAERK